MGFFLFLVYLVLTFLRPAELYPQLESMHIMDIASVLALAGAAIGVLGGRGPTHRAPQPYLAILFIFWAAFSVLVTQRWFGGFFSVWGDFLRASGLVFLLVVLNVDSLPRFRATVAVLAVLGVLVATQAIAAYYLGWRSESFLLAERLNPEGEMEEVAWDSRADGEDDSGPDTRPVVVRARGLGFLNDPNDLGQMIVALLPLVFAMRWRSRRLRNTVFVWMPVAILLIGLAMTRSRGGFLALFAVLFFALRHRVGRVLSLALTVVAAVGMLVMGVSGGRTLSVDESALGRISAWAEGLQMLKSSPLWGVGYRSFGEYHELVAHNSFVHCFAELGLIGYFLWLSLIVLTTAEAASLCREEGWDHGEPLARWGRAIQLALIGFLAAALFLSRTYGVMLFLLLGLGTALGDIARREGHVTLPGSAMGWAARIAAFEAASILGVWVFVGFFRKAL